MLPALLILGLQGPFAELAERPEWQTYHKRINQSEAIQAQWEENWDVEISDGGRQRRFTLRFARPQRISHELTGIYRRIWNGREGLVLDLRKKTYRRVTECPEFNRTYFLGITAIPQNLEPNLAKLSTLASQVRFAGADCLRLRHQPVFAHAGRYEWFLNRSTGLLIGFKEEHSYRLIAQATTFVNVLELSPKISEEDFSLTPPAGFVADSSQEPTE